MSRSAAVTESRRQRGALTRAALAVVTAVLTCLCAAGVASAATAHARVRVSRAVSADRHALADLFATRAGAPVATDSVHVATLAATGRQWAIASFRPTTSLTRAQQLRFQDAGAGIFTRASRTGSWTLAARGVAPLACDPVIPAGVRAAWHLAPAVRCGGAGPRAAALARRQLAPTTDSAGGSSAGTSFASRIASIALSQVGESDIPVSTSFGSDCDPYTTLDGPPYAAPSNRGCSYDSEFGVENENEEWCADFADWVWRQAGVTTDMGLIDPAASSYYAWGKAQGESLPIDPTNPQVGDAVVFYEPGAITPTTPADHVGIITAVHPNGTVDLVDGDFIGATNIGVEDDTNVDLATWSSQVWSPGEQWVFVTPPTGAQPPTPTATVSGPHVVAADTPTTFHASGSEAGGSITSEAWSFGAGNAVPGADPTGATVQHVFSDPGRQTVTMIATSSRHTITVKTFNVDVVAPSSSVASTPSDAVYYSDRPVTQRSFAVDGSGALTEESFDGASWLDESLPGAWTADSPLTTLDGKLNGTLTPHVFGRSAAGGLQEAVLAGTTWSVQSLAGSPAAGSPIAAANVVPARADGSARPFPAVFFFDAAGRLVESAAPHGTWVTSVVARAHSVRGARTLAIGTVPGPSGPVVTVYTASRGGRLLAFARRGGSWIAEPVSGWLRVARHGALAAVDAAAAGDPAVFFVDRAGRLADASAGPFGLVGRTAQIPSAPVRPAAGLQATGEVTGDGTVVPEVASVSPAGAPQVTSGAGGRWSTQTLPGAASRLLGLGAYPVAGYPQQLVFTGADGVQADAATSASGPWTSTALPATPAAFPERVVLYAADAGDLQTATSAAQGAGLAASQVTGDFATAWDDAVSGDYLVITVGSPATSALYFNACGWTNPSGAVAGSTPFGEATAPVDHLPGADVFEQADGSTSADTAALATDLAYDAVHGAYPPGVQSPPTQATPTDACSGSPSVG